MDAPWNREPAWIITPAPPFFTPIDTEHIVWNWDDFLWLGICLNMEIMFFISWHKAEIW